MEISSSSLNFRLSIIGIEELKPHEEVINEVVERLSREISADGVVHDPLIVDQNDYLILDGMHRFNSLKRLDCRFAPCCLLDYGSPKIKVGSWFRIFTVDDPIPVAQNSLSKMNLNYSKRRVDATIMSYDSESIILTKDGTIFSLPSPLDPVERCRTAVRIEKHLVNDGHHVTYLSEVNAMQRLKSDATNLAIALPVFRKEEIRDFGLEGRLLPHKVTRHVIPSRPLAVDIPLTLLRNTAISCQEADGRLTELLARRRIDRKPPGSFVEGRRYDEELLVFSQ
ncbi:MAG: ParB N-terminal domain-containing protein [Candidatus Bathyarchaeia archaeon]